MSTIKDGGPAFPVPNDANLNDQEGMTLRDYFAAKAMASVSADEEHVKAIARYAYRMADAMLAAREVQP